MSSKAYVMSDGEIVSDSAMKQYAIKQKAEGSNKIPSDTFQEQYSRNGLVEPLYNPEGLAQLLELNTYHYRAVKTKARDTAGLGWTLQPKDGIESPSDEQYEKAKTFLENLNPDKTLTQINDMVMVDYEATGDGYFEVIRGEDGLVVGLEHIPSHTMRIHNSMEKFCQIRGNKKVWFKRFGIEQELDYRTGYPLEDDEEEFKATEVIHIRNYTSRSDYYGVPDILPALGCVLADRERSEYNISFFENHAVPSYVVTVTGTDLDDDTKATIKKYFQEDVKKNRHSTLILTAQKDPNSYTEEPIEIKFQALSVEQKDASFRLFRQDNRDEILSAHGVPPYRAGVNVVGNLGGSTAKESTEIYKQSIIEPRQEMLEGVMNRYILGQGLEITDWNFKLNDIDTRDEQAEINNLQLLFNMGVYSPNQILEKLGEEPIDDPNMDLHYINGVAMGLSQEETGALMLSLKQFHKKLMEVATKERKQDG